MVGLDKAKNVSPLSPRLACFELLCPFQSFEDKDGFHEVKCRGSCALFYVIHRGPNRVVRGCYFGSEIQDELLRRLF